MHLKIILILILPHFLHAEEYKVTDRVYLDVAIEEKKLGRIEIGLFGQVAPLTVKNFLHIATQGINGKTYKGSTFHRVIKRFMIQGGDIVSGDGKGSVSIYGDQFPDENFTLNHTGPGLVSMVNSGPDTNGCQFFITTIGTPFLNGKHTVFGKVLRGQALVHEIERVKTDSDDVPFQKIEIIDCGALDTPEPFYTTLEIQYTFWTWLSAGAVPLSFSFAILLFFCWVLRQLDRIKIKYV